MKTLKNTAVIAVITSLLFSCGSSISREEATSEGFTAIEKEMQNKFGKQAYYTDLTISYDKSIGNMISTTVTEDPESLKMGEWTFVQGAWKQTSEITLEIPEGSLAADFMFQLNDNINLSKLGELVEISKIELTKEKEIESPTLEMAFVKFPDNGDVSKAEYVVMLEPENGGTTFSFHYEMNGELIKMNY